jgi:hypothetical protein
VNRRDRARVDDALQGLSLFAVQTGAATRRLARRETLWSLGVEAQHPVAHGLQSNRPDPGRVRAGSAVIDRRQREQPPGLVGITRSLGQGSKLGGVKVGAQGDRSGHGDLREGDRLSITPQ